MELILINDYEVRLACYWVRSINEARELWCEIARFPGCNLIGFEVVSEDGEVVYRGNFITDEC